MSDSNPELLTQLDTLIVAAGDAFEAYNPPDAEYEKALKSYTTLIDQRKKLVPEPVPETIEVEVPKHSRWAWTKDLIAPAFGLVATLAILWTEVNGHQAKQAWDEKKNIKSGR